MARIAVHPAVRELVDMVGMAADLRIEELGVGDGSVLARAECQGCLRPHDGVMMLAVKKFRRAAASCHPRPDAILGRGDLLIVVGPAAALAQWCGRGHRTMLHVDASGDLVAFGRRNIPLDDVRSCT